MVDIETNPLYYASIGGIILAISTSLHYVLKGNVTGISGIIYDLAFFNMSQFPNKLIIVGGIIMISGIFFDIFKYETYNGFTPYGPKQLISQHTTYLGFALAGLLVGFGAKLGNGCTSGHGLCGLPRFSIRSYVAVAVFLSSAIGIATIKYYFTLGPFSEKLSPSLQYDHLISANLCIVFGFVFLIIGFLVQKIYNKPQQDPLVILRDNLISLLVGSIFGCGLVVSGMVRRRNILQFLWIGKDWNPSLLFVLGCAVIINLIVFNYMIRVSKKPIFGQKLFNPDNNVIDWKLILGAFSFGLGWGIGGLCPGPALALLPVFQIQIHIIWIACLLFGMFCANKFIQYTQNKNKQTENNRIRNQKIENMIEVHHKTDKKLQPIRRKSQTKITKIDDHQIENQNGFNRETLDERSESNAEVLKLDDNNNFKHKLSQKNQNKAGKLLTQKQNFNLKSWQQEQSSSIRL